MDPHHWHTSGSKLESCKLTWVIENALLQFGTDGQLNSSVFGSAKSGQWMLRILVEKKELYFYLFSKCTGIKKALCTVSIVDSSGLVKRTISMPIACFAEGNQGQILGATLKMQYLIEHKMYLPYGKLTLLCTVSRLVVPNEIKYNMAAVLVPKCTLTDQLSTLLQDGNYSDMVVKVAGQEIKAHKNILALRSPVFAAMLNCPMKESRQNRVVITDCDYDVVKEMLHYIYTGKAPNVGKMAERLLVAADKYALDGLKAMCEQVLCETLSVETAMSLLAVAEMYNANQLKDVTNDYIKANLSDVMSTADCTGLIAERAAQLYPKKRRLE